MNHKLPYEHLIAEKMQHLPLPQAEESWQQMKTLLDNEMPAPPSGGRNGFRPNKWWWMGSVLVILIGTAIFSTQSGLWKTGNARLANVQSASNSKNNSNNNSENKNQKSSNTDANNSTLNLNSTTESNSQTGDNNKDIASQDNNSSKAVDEKSADQSSPNTGSTGKSSLSSSPEINSAKSNSSKENIATELAGSSSKNNSGVPNAKNKNNIESKSNGDVAGSVGKANENSGKTNNSIDHKNKTTTNKNKTVLAAGAGVAGAAALNSPSKSGSIKSNSTSSKSKSVQHPADVQNNLAANPKSNSAQSNLTGNNHKSTGNTNRDVSNSAGQISAYTGSQLPKPVVERTPDITTLKYTDRRTWLQWGQSDNINYKNINAAASPYSKKNGAANPYAELSKKELERQTRKVERNQRHEEAVANRKPFLGEKTDRWFAAGLAPYQNFAIASQEAYNYNSSANKGIATDYIPAPYLQFHLTDRVYVLGEFQFNSPQATSSVLLSQKEAFQPGSQYGYVQNIYLKKLYYFNMPFSFYYSPVKNVYLGSGLQFSSLNSGIAYLEQKNSSNQLLYSETFKIKEDSLASKLNGSEWRYLFDANYYWNRFMFGFRYNQALGNYINIQVNNVTSQARNQAFLLYFRYNIIVSGRKDSQFDPLKY